MRSDSWWLRLAGAGGVFMGLLLAVDAWPLLRGPREWQWAIAAVPPPSAILATVLAIALFLLGWWWLGRYVAERPNWALVGLGLLTLGVQFSLLWAVRDNPADILFERLASDQASGYFTVAATIEHLPTFLREFPERLPLFTPDPHPRSKPPGIILVYWTAERLMEAWPAAAAWLGHWARGVRCGDLALATRPDAALAANGLVALLTPLLSTAVMWPTFHFTARRRGAAGGWLAAGLVALLPGRLLFAPHMDTIYPLLTLLALLAVDNGLQRRRWAWTAVGGFVVGIATFLSLVNGLTGLLLALFITFECRPDRRLRPWLSHGAALAAGAALPWLVYWASSRVTPWAIYFAAAPARHDLARAYATWLPGNFYDFALFAGLPAFTLALVAILSRRNRSMGWAFWLLLVSIVVSGAIRGEVGRIWLMLAPLPALLTAGTFGSISGAGRHRAQLTIIVGTAVLTAVMGLRLEVTQLEWPAPSPHAMSGQLPDGLIAEPHVFGPDIVLLAAEVIATIPLELQLYWQAERRPDIPYTVFIHVIDSDGNIAMQLDGMPGQGLVPTTCWQTGEVFIDQMTLDTRILPAGPYRVDIGLYDASDATRLGAAVEVTRFERP